MNFSGKNILLTGGTNGLGLSIARLLVGEGATVYAMGRSLKVSIPGSGRYLFIKTDFADLHGVRNALNDLIDRKIIFDIIINNAGVLTPPDFRETADGFEYSFQVNFLSHLLINEILFSERAVSKGTTVMVTTSPVYRYFRPSFEFPARENYKPFRIYSDSKYYTLLTGDFLRERYPDSELIFMGFDPGTFSSGIYRMQPWWFHSIYRTGAYFMRSSEKVADGALRALSSDNKIFNGVYSVRGGLKKFTPADQEMAGKFTDKCLESIRAYLS